MSPRHSTRPRPALRAACSAVVLFAAMASVAVARPRPTPDGPTGTVTGRIVRSDGPKYDVHVIDQMTWMTVITRPDGTFRFEHLPVGKHVFRIRSDYCDVQLVRVSVRAGETARLDVELVCRPRPCPKPDRADPTCIEEHPEEREHVGTHCEVHRRTKLELDLVPIHYSISGYTPGRGGDERKSFPNARPWWSGGCVDTGQRWAEVAYCRDCRHAYQAWSAMWRRPERGGTTMRRSRP